MNIFLSAFAPEKLVSRDGFGGPVPRQPAHLHSQAESGAYLRDSSGVPRRRLLVYLKPPYAIGSVPSLSGHASAYRWRSLPRVRRHRASKPQGSSERALPWQVTMGQLICASLSEPLIEPTDPRTPAPEPAKLFKNGVRGGRGGGGVAGAHASRGHGLTTCDQSSVVGWTEIVAVPFCSTFSCLVQYLFVSCVCGDFDSGVES